MRPAVFLDRDGTLIEERGYICSFEQVSLFPFVPEALRHLRAAGFCVVLVTNQSSVARGICSVEQVKTLHNRLLDVLENQGVCIDAVYWCPFHPRGKVAEFSVESHLRKPAPGMLFQAAADLELDLSRSLMIGDKYTDLAAGAAAGCHTALVRTGYGAKTELALAAGELKPDLVADDLLEAISRWLDQKTAWA
ncbi:MAG: HAD family hydrolase [Acidobacteriota bacterium]|jgi:D-glycero-D-manno-heptose 1,7-bisphosphate phosphatase|nr:HAD family hydrolase [Acidobacteriota bacterium]